MLLKSNWGVGVASELAAVAAAIIPAAANVFIKIIWWF
jgi:hypothetical protein